MSLGAPTLCVTALLLVAIIAAEVSPGSPGNAKQASPVNAHATADQSPAQASDDAARPGATSAWAATALSRPLFVPGRRPHQAKAAGSESGPGLPRLSGVLVSPSERVAIFAADASHQSLVIRVGSSIGGYQVQSIEAGQVVLRDDGGPRILRPTFSAPVQVAKTPAPVDLSRVRPTAEAINALERRAAARGIASLKEDGALQAAEDQSTQ